MDNNVPPTPVAPQPQQPAGTKHHGTPALRVIALVVFALLIAVLSSLGTYYFLGNNQTQEVPVVVPVKKSPTVAPTRGTELTPTTTVKINSINCKQIDTNDPSYSEWKSRLESTQTIKQLQTDTGPTTTYSIELGTLCQLEQKLKLISFGHTKNVKQAELINSTYTKGFFIYTDQNKEELSIADIKCERKPPDATSPIAITSVENGIVHIKCPGFEPTQRFDYNLQTKTLLQR